MKIITQCKHAKLDGQKVVHHKAAIYQTSITLTFRVSPTNCASDNLEKLGSQHAYPWYNNLQTTIKLPQFDFTVIKFVHTTYIYCTLCKMFFHFSTFVGKIYICNKHLRHPLNLKAEAYTENHWVYLIISQLIYKYLCIKEQINTKNA